MSLRSRLRAVELATRPEPPDLEAALRKRWGELPEAVRTPQQMLGRRTTGCEGTHGVFPRCDLACTPCYHGRDANRVRVDAAHTVTEVDRQMAHLRTVRGPGQHAQLIGGEVTLLGPEAHAEALLAMQRHGRKPMSMSHGDFDYDYLVRLVQAGGFRHLSFAGHFDSLMLGRRGAARPRTEAELHEHRQRFCALFHRLEREYGVTSHLAHNMTVTPRNLGGVAEVVRAGRDMGFRMFSFQPAAFVGNPKRWREDLRAIGGDEVWAEMERGAGARLHWRALQIGDVRCNRTAYGGFAGDRYVPLLDEDDPRDAAWLAAFVGAFGGLDFAAPPGLVAARVARGLARHPRAVPEALGWARRFARRARGRIRPVTFVMHSFMDAAVVAPAWEHLQAGTRPAAPDVLEAWERLQACSYSMSHPADGALVPACAQHSVLDPAETARLALELPLRRVAAPRSRGA